MSKKQKKKGFHHEEFKFLLFTVLTIYFGVFFGFSASPENTLAWWCTARVGGRLFV